MIARIVAAFAIAAFAAAGCGAQHPEDLDPFGEFRVPLAEAEIVGDSGPALVIIPCASCRWTSFRTFMERNADRYRIMAVTLPGFGGSPRPDLPVYTDEPVWQRNAVAAVIRAVEEAGWEDVTFIGHSFGSAIAQHVVHERPDLAAGLINIDGNWLDSLDWRAMTQAERVENMNSVIEQYGEPLLEDIDAWRRLNTPAIADYDDRFEHHGFFMATDKVSMIHYWRENMLVYRNEFFSDIDAPMLDIQAVRPWDETPEETRRNYLAQWDEIGRPDNLDIVFVYNTGHFIQSDRPELLDAIIADFIAGREIDDRRPESDLGYDR